MPKQYGQCQFFNQDQLRCPIWFDCTEGTADQHEKFCREHREIKDASIVSYRSLDGTIKTQYIDFVNAQRTACVDMSDDELDTHIAGLESTLAEIRAKMLTARAVRAEKLDKLTEDERAERRKVKFERVVSAERAKKPAKTSLAKDPILYFMEKHGLSREQATALMGDD